MRFTRRALAVVATTILVVACSSSDGDDDGSAACPKTQVGAKCAAIEDCGFHACRCNDSSIQSKRECIEGACASACYVCPGACEAHGGTSS